MKVSQRKFARVITATCLLLVVTLLAGCNADDPQNTFDPKGSVAEDLRDLIVPIAWIAVAVLILVWGGMVYILWRFRHREGDPMPKQTHGNTRLELAWTIAPALLLAAIGVPTIATLFELSDIPDDAMEIRVTAHQWWWEFEYPEQGVLTANEMHIPLHRPIKLTLISADVIHSFWVPKLAGKTDIVPNNINTMWLNASEAGEYSGQCAEFCGLSHALMRFRVFAEPEGDFLAWVDTQKRTASRPSDRLAQQGTDKFATTCAVCHTISGTSAAGKVGPNLTHFGARTTLAGGILVSNADNIKRWLRKPSDVKPGSRMPNLGLTNAEIDALTAYLQTLK